MIIDLGTVLVCNRKRNTRYLKVRDGRREFKHGANSKPTFCHGLFTLTINIKMRNNSYLEII